jgi:hypothetical protein
MRLEEQEFYRKVLLNYESVCFGNEVCFLLRDGKKKEKRERECCWREWEVRKIGFCFLICFVRREWCAVCVCVRERECKKNSVSFGFGLGYYSLLSE